VIEFEAFEVHADGSLRSARYAYRGSAAEGWEILREGKAHVRLGPGYRLVRTSHCGVCSTDLARRFLPFPLPQVAGHEAVAREEDGTLLAVEINASHAARGLPEAKTCPFCSTGLERHCPERLVLGIHDLPGGFAPWMLVPVRAVHPLPPSLPPLAATFVEPFAAALHGVRTIAPRAGETVAVLGVRKLGLLLVAALAAERAHRGVRFEILAIGKHPDQLRLATALGADRAVLSSALDPRKPEADVVIEATGKPDSLPLAAALARREVHVKSTTGHETFGLRHLTEFVVDELSLTPLRGGATPPPPPAAVVARTLETIDRAIRPDPRREAGAVRARGTIYVEDVGQERPGILEPLLGRGLRFSSSRCGDFAPAIEVLADPKTGLGTRLPELLVKDRFAASRLPEAFARAAEPSALKVVVTHEGARV
jgi:threonine dehydrogenase-like Zn-dependent dehydrogenase